MRIEVITQVREAEAEILRGYTQMGGAINILASLTRQLGMDLDAKEEVAGKILTRLDQILEEAGFPKEETALTGPQSLQLIERLQRLADYSKPQAAIDTLQHLLSWLGHAISGTETIDQLARGISDLIQLQVEGLTKRARDKTEIIERCHTLFDTHGPPQRPKMALLLEERIRKLIERNSFLEKRVEELEHGIEDK